MIPLSLMQTIVGAIAEDGTSALAEELLAPWAHDRGSARFLRASANILFTFTQSGQRRVLRFNMAEARPIGQLQAELDYLEHLASAGLRVALPLRARGGRFVESAHTAQGLFHSVVFEALEGQQHEIDALTPAMLAQWGKALGALHRAAQSYQKSGRPSWSEQLQQVAAQLAAEEDAARAALARIAAELHALPASADTFGLIHFDFELDNLLWEAERLGIVDFDDCAWSWYAADIAYALRDLFDDSVDKIDLGNSALMDFIAGYRTERGVAAEELAHMPLFLRLHHLLTFAKLRHALADDPPPKQPAWAGALRQKLERKAQRYREEFAAYI